LAVIAGIGADICRISRMKRAIASPRFVRRIFCDEEIEYARSGGIPEQHFASAFAAKEALAKASGLGLGRLGLSSSWVRRTPEGPVIMLTEELQKKFEERGVNRSWLSLAHEGDYAIAFVVLES
jgi:holo-[acyl-carrier protein] synthase